MHVRLHDDPHHSGRRWHVEFDGEMIVLASRDPECDLARALLARGIAGTITILDCETGRPRTRVNIEEAARLIVVETGNAPRFRGLACAQRRQAPETPPPGGDVPEAA